MAIGRITKSGFSQSKSTYSSTNTKVHSQKAIHAESRKISTRELKLPERKLDPGDDRGDESEEAANEGC